MHAAGVSFPEVLQTRGEYQIKPPLPFVPGSEVGGHRAQRARRRGGEGRRPRRGVLHARRLRRGRGRARLPDLRAARRRWTSPRAPALILNYHTAYFSLVLRGRLAEGETVLVHGAAGGVGTASLQVAKGLGARTIAVVSSDEKERVAREAGADEVVRSDGAWKDEAKELSGGGVDVVLDPVGGDRFTDSLRSLARGRPRRSWSASPAARSPRCKVNRLLLNNTRGRRRGLGRLRAGQARGQPRDRRGASLRWSTRASCGRSSARASRSSGRARRSS